MEPHWIRRLPCDLFHDVPSRLQKGVAESLVGFEIGSLPPFVPSVDE